MKTFLRDAAAIVIVTLAFVPLTILIIAGVLVLVILYCLDRIWNLLHYFTKRRNRDA